MDDVYGGTRRYFSRIAQPQGYKYSFFSSLWRMRIL
jgi:cystathionine beta-lyase/cystathionine gamma-synthase